MRIYTHLPYESFAIHIRMDNDHRGERLQIEATTEPTEYTKVSYKGNSSPTNCDASTYMERGTALNAPKYWKMLTDTPRDPSNNLDGKALVRSLMAKFYESRCGAPEGNFEFILAAPARMGIIPGIYKSSSVTIRGKLGLKDTGGWEDGDYLGGPDPPFDTVALEIIKDLDTGPQSTTRITISKNNGKEEGKGAAEKNASREVTMGWEHSKRVRLEEKGPWP